MKLSSILPKKFKSSKPDQSPPGTRETVKAGDQDRLDHLSGAQKNALVTQSVSAEASPLASPRSTPSTQDSRNAVMRDFMQTVEELRKDQRENFPGDVERWFDARFGHLDLTPDRNPHTEWGARPKSEAKE